MHLPILQIAPELAQTLVRMNTVSANSNLELIHFIRDNCRPWACVAA
jgi:hypothetical protein